MPDINNLKYDGKPVMKKEPEPELNQDEMTGFILRRTSERHSLTYEEVQAVLDAETEYLRQKGFIDN